MVPHAVPLAALCLLSLAPVTLRYKHVPGTELRYTTTQSSITTMKVADGQPVESRRSNTTVTEKHVVVSSANGMSVVEETPIAGTTVVEVPRPKLTEIVAEITRIHTYDALGRCLKVERRAPLGMTAPPPQFLDGLSIPLPQRPVNVGETWNGTIQTLSTDGKTPLTLNYKSTLAAVESSGGKRIARIEVTLEAKLPPSPAAAETGSVTGKAVQKHDIEAGRDVEVSGQIMVQSSGTVTREGKQQPVMLLTTITFTTKLESR